MFRHLKLEIALEIPALNESKIKRNKQLSRIRVKIFVDTFPVNGLSREPFHLFKFLATCFLATATHNSNWFKITHICLICDEKIANFDITTVI